MPFSRHGCPLREVFACLILCWIWWNIQAFEVELLIGRQSLNISIIFNVDRSGSILVFSRHRLFLLLLCIPDILLLNDLIIKACIIPFVYIVVFYLRRPRLIILINSGMFQTVFWYDRNLPKMFQLLLFRWHVNIYCRMIIKSLSVRWLLERFIYNLWEFLSVWHRSFRRHLIYII